MPLVEQVAVARQRPWADRHQRRLTALQQRRAALAVAGDPSPGGETILDALQRGDALAVQQLAGPGRQQFRERRGDEADFAVALQRGAVALQKQVALRPLAGFLARIVEHQQGGVGRAAQSAVEHFLQGRGIAPDGGGEVQRVGDVGVVGQHPGQFVALSGVERRQPQAVALGVVSDQPGVAAGTGQRDQARPARQVAAGGGLEGFDEAHRAAHTDYPEALEQAVVERVGTGQGTGVAEREGRTDLRHSGLQGDHRHAFLQRLVGRAGEPRDVLQTFQMQADGSHPRLVEQHVHQLGDAQLRLVAHRCHIGHRQRTVAHRQVVGEVAALRQHRDAPLHLPTAMCHRP